MRVGSLFSGIGGLDLGLERAGMEIIWQVENNPFCQKVLKKHWPEVPCYGDIKEIDFTTLPPIDLICGGFPCQPVSCAGKRQGDKDERWLWPEFYRTVCEARPRWVLVENVPGLLSAEDGRLFGGILGDLARSGYDAEWDLLPAAAFGAPHLRFRLFLVAYNLWSGTGVEKYRSGGQRGQSADSLESEILRQENGEVGSKRVNSSCKTLANPRRNGWGQNQPGRETQGGTAPRGHGEVVADAGLPSRSSWRPVIYGSGSPNGEREATRIEGQGIDRARAWWATEPDVGRVANGIPSRVDRLKCLGNAVVPQVAEWLGKRIMESLNDHP